MPFYRANLIDQPNFRSSHNFAKPKGGGISFVLSSYFGFFFFKNYIPFLFAPLAFVGLLDDKFNIPRSIRYITQFITSFILINLFIEQFNSLNFYQFLIFIIFWQILATGLINFTNFMDGIDGLIASLMIVTLTADSIINRRVSSLPLLVSLISFLFWNWDPSKLFMGDIGSTFLGLYLPYSIISSSSLNNAIALFVISSPLWLDAFTCLIRRFMNNENIFKPHKKHLYQRLTQAGWSHSEVTLLYSLASIVLSIMYIVGGNLELFIGFIITIFVGFFLEIAKSFPFKVD